jgi:hypothetical protein
VAGDLSIDGLLVDGQTRPEQVEDHQRPGQRGHRQQDPIGLSGRCHASRTRRAGAALPTA